MSNLNQSLAAGPTDTDIFRRLGIARKRILVVESDGFTRLVLIYLFRVAGMAVDFTANGTLALSTLRRLPPDALLIELKPHGLSGLELIKSARRDSRFGDRPIYVFSEEELMSRGTRKDLLKSAAKIVDRRRTTMEGLVRRIVKDLTGATLGDSTESWTKGMLDRPDAGRTVPEGDMDEAIGGVRGQSKPPAKSGVSEELVMRALSEAQSGNMPRAPRMPPVPAFAVASLGSHALVSSREDSTAQAMAVTGFPDEQVQPGIAGAVVPESQDETEDLLSTETATEEAVDEDKVEVVRPCLPDPQEISGLTAEPIAEAEAAENDWTIGTVGIAAPCPSPVQGEAGLVREEEEGTFLFQSTTSVSETGAENQSGIRPVQDESAIQNQVSAAHEKGRGTLAQQILAAFNAQDSDQRGVHRHEETTDDHQPPPGDVVEQSQSVALSERVNDLERELHEQASELERARIDLEKQAEERKQIESDLRAELGKREGALQEAELKREQAETRSLQLDQELSGLKQADTDLTCRFDNEQQAKITLTELVKELEQDLGAQASELERARIDLVKQAEERERAESGLCAELRQAGSALKQAELKRNQAEAKSAQLERELAGLKQAELERNQAEARSAQLEQELSGLKRNDAELSCRFDNEQQAKATLAELVKELDQKLNEQESELERARAELERQAKERTCVEVDLRGELEKAESALKRADLERGQAEARSGQLDQALAGLKRIEEELNSRLDNEQQAKATLAELVKELEQKLNERVSELERARGELERQAKERACAEVDLRGELEKADSALKQAELERGQAEARSSQSEQELAGLRLADLELNRQLNNEHEANAGLTRRINELEQDLAERASELECARGELATQAKERERVEADLRGELQKVVGALDQAERGQEQSQARCAQLEQELNALRELQARLNAQLAQGQQEAALLRARNQELGKQLQQVRELNTHLRKNLSSFEEAHKTLRSAQHNLESQSEAVLSSAQESEAKLRAEAAERQRLTGDLEAAKRALAQGSRTCEELEAEIERLRRAQQESDSKSKQEAAESRRLREELESAQHSLRDRSQRAELELGKLQSALQFAQVDSSRREMQVVRMRHFLKGSGRARLLRKTLHREMREPVDNLQQAARSLLELEMGEEQKQLAQQIMRDAIAIDARLREPESTEVASTEAAPVSANGGGTV